MKQDSFDEYVNNKYQGLCPNEKEEMLEICHEAMLESDVNWHEYETYTIVDVHPDPEGAKMGRPI